MCRALALELGEGTVVLAVRGNEVLGGGEIHRDHRCQALSKGLIETQVFCVIAFLHHPPHLTAISFWSDRKKGILSQPSLQLFLGQVIVLANWTEVIDIILNLKHGVSFSLLTSAKMIVLLLWTLKMETDWTTAWKAATPESSLIGTHFC